MIQPPKAVILTIGDELLRGTVLNSNARFLSRELTALGFEVVSQLSCRDQITEIVHAFKAVLSAADLIVLTGGLGPTPDDVTRDALAAYYHVPLQLSKKQYRFIESYYRKRKRSVPAMVKKEAMFPANSKPLFNRFGIALGFLIHQEGKTVIVLPGVPYELEKMTAKLVIPQLKKYFPKLRSRLKLIVKTVGLPETVVMEKLKKDFFQDIFDFGIYPDTGEVTLRLYAESTRILKRLKSKILHRLKSDIYAWEETCLSQVVGSLLHQKRKNLAVAESCTGGLLAFLITQIPGSSQYFRGSVTVYQPEVKTWLGVLPATLKKEGAVSSAVAQELAEKIRIRMNADFGIGITGVAGPKKDGKNPRGCVYIAIASAGKTYCWNENFSGDRNQVQLKAAKKSLEYLWRLLSHQG